jgi:hypothetical protein
MGISAIFNVHRIIFVSYFNINNAKKAFSKLLAMHLNSQTFQISYVGDNIGEKTLLTSIHESSDSNKSDKDEEGSDSEKKEIETVNVSAKEKADPTKEEIKIQKQPSPTVEPNEGWRPLQDFPSPELNVTMVLPQNPRLIPQLPHPQYYSHSPATNLGRRDHLDRTYICSECSLDYDTTSEG